MVVLMVASVALVVVLVVQGVVCWTGRGSGKLLLATATGVKKTHPLDHQEHHQDHQNYHQDHQLFFFSLFSEHDHELSDWYR